MNFAFTASVGLPRLALTSGLRLAAPLSTRPPCRLALHARPTMLNADIVRAPSADTAIFTPYVVHDGVCTISGVLSAGAAGDAAAQTRGTLAKIDALFSDAGTSKERILSGTIWLADIEKDLKAFNEEWGKWLDRSNKPVRACIEAKLISPEYCVEIQASAAMPPAAPVIIKTADAAPAVGPYAQAVRMRDGTVFVSGCIGLTPAGDFAGESVEEQAVQVFKNLAAILKESGPNAQVIKTTVLLDNMADFAKVNELYAAFFAEGGPAEGPVPARACFAAQTLPKGALVEIEAIAQVDI